MANSPFWFGANAIDDTAANAITKLSSFGSTDRVLVVKWSDIAASLTNGSTATPDSGEDWLSAICWNGLSVTANTQNAARRAAFAQGGLTIDQGYFIPGSTFLVYPITLSIYSPTSFSTKPDATLI